MQMERTIIMRMRKIALGVTLLICMAVTAHSQEQPPQLLLRATFGYFLDEKSYPTDKVVYVVNYPTPSRSKGLVFAVFLSEKDGHQILNVQNNASFVLSKSERSGVYFDNPPLGGAWTQEHLALAIKQIEKQPRFTIYVKELSSIDTTISCEAYTDPQRKADGK